MISSAAGRTRTDRPTTALVNRLDRKSRESLEKYLANKDGP